MSLPLSVHVHLLPSLIPPGSLQGGIAVVVDVLRATTVMVRALMAGCTAVIPCLEIDQAHRVAGGLPAGTGLLAGERQGLPIEGFDLGNSPVSFTEERCRGRSLVMTTTNGTRAILASLDADRVLVASFGNVRATASEVLASGMDLHVVCSGTDGLISWEDTLLAGAIIQRVQGLLASFDPPLPLGNDGALIAFDLWQRLGIGNDGTGLADALRRGRGGRRVAELGLDADIVEASRLDWCDQTAELYRNPLQIQMNP